MSDTIIDAFANNLQLPFSNPWMAAAAHQMEPLRRSTRYNCHVFLVPDSPFVTIHPYSTHATQVRIPAGSWLWAVMFQPIVDNQGGGSSYRIAEQGTGLMLMANFKDRDNSAVVPRNAQPLIEPRPIL